MSKRIFLSLLFLLFMLPGTLLAACITPISFDTDVADSWETNCASEHRDNSYAKYYTFTLASDLEVTIDLTSKQDTFLYLLSGSDETGSIVDQNDDGGSGSNSRIVITLVAGTYTVEATTYSPFTTGNFVVSVYRDVPAEGDCGEVIPLNTDVSGSWKSDCASQHRAGSYAKYYTFTLANSKDVTIDLTSTQDTYMYLLSGSSQTGSVLLEDDDGGSGSNSRIIITLFAGTYTVEATTFDSGVSGNFVVSVTTDLPSTSACIEPIATNTSIMDAWEAGCGSRHRPQSYAKYFTFTLLSSQEVTIDLQSTDADSYLYLLSGSGQTGPLIEQDDDGGSSGSDARIVRTLSAGTYTIEATTYAASRTGDFVVSLNVSGCTDCPFQINAGLNDAWYSPATSGQGLTITVFPDSKQVFVAWFTFDTERPPEDVTAMLGEPGHRWLTAQGPYDGDTAELTIYVTEGGVFDSPNPAATTDEDGDGTLTLEFADCNDALATYEITSLDISGEIPLQRIVTENVPLCELLANP